MTSLIHSRIPRRTRRILDRIVALDDAGRLTLETAEPLVRRLLEQANVRTCPECGESFAWKKATAAYCSEACKKKAKRRRDDPEVGTLERRLNQRDALDMIRLAKNPDGRHVPGVGETGYIDEGDFRPDDRPYVGKIRAGAWRKGMAARRRSRNRVEYDLYLWAGMKPSGDRFAEGRPKSLAAIEKMVAKRARLPKHRAAAKAAADAYAARLEVIAARLNADAEARDVRLRGRDSRAQDQKTTSLEEANPMIDVPSLEQSRADAVRLVELHARMVDALEDISEIAERLLVKFPDDELVLSAVEDFIASVPSDR